MASSLLLPLFLLSAVLPSISANIEVEALLRLKNRLQDPTNALQSWDPTQFADPCIWSRVTCDAESRVVRLDLGSCSLSGRLGPELSVLKHLQYLELYSNNFEGKIPKRLGKLKSLISMDLYENKLQGRIPKAFAKLKSLKFMRLNNNKLTGPIPRKLTALSNLQVFDVSNNDLCGTIPTGGPFAKFPSQSYENNSRLIGAGQEGHLPHDFGC